MSRTGIGFDSHRLVAGRRLILGGVEIEYDRGLEGHSDADALVHAIIDALLGAAGLDDIGQHFPDTDPQFKDVDSMGLLGHAVGLVLKAGYDISHVDTTVIAEEPRLSPHRDAIRLSLTGALTGATVNVKFSTAERMGALGRTEGIAALAVVTLD